MACICIRPNWSWADFENDECPCDRVDDYSDVISDEDDHCCANCVYYCNVDE